jgi:hypothetical protein
MVKIIELTLIKTSSQLSHSPNDYSSQTNLSKAIQESYVNDHSQLSHRYPFMAADLLSCSMKIADALIQTIEKPVPEEKPASQDDSQSHQENKKSDYKSVE